MLPKNALIECGGANLVERHCECVGCRLADKNAGLSVDDRFGCASVAKSDDGAAAALGLDRNHPEVLNSWQERGGGLPIQLTNFVIRPPTEEANIRPADA